MKKTGNSAKDGKATGSPSKLIDARIKAPRRLAW